MASVTVHRSGDRSRRDDRSRTEKLLAIGPATRSVLTALMLIVAVIVLCPLFWLVVSITKNQQELYSSFGLWFHGPFVLWQNLHDLSTYQSGIFWRWLANTFLYTVVGGGGATLISALGGYAFSRFEFRGKHATFVLVVASLLIPTTAVTIPTYLLYSQVGLVNNPLGMIIPSLVSPIGIYLMRVFVDGAIPREVLDAARVDGANEWTIFQRVAVPLMMPGIVTVLLLSFVATWNNYFLPFIIFSRETSYPVTVGLSLWASQAANGGGSSAQLYPLVVTGAVVAIIPLMIVFIVLQRFWRSGLLGGAVK